ncbi:putative nucleoside-diphosphate-sugar epimerase [Gaiella occulta]|uniref:Putative nucleoside-diphosphate-sugar epimerase n=1 Tax=Gaiella occulta TaxID=1002870 RepID=A0A7M2YW67_9ACTN|nr:SDR family oxidoreductase [Gaiella occulta]RDI74381.1 putative nucleoside-diphosphate-sugar epimerase [Gaiella occulta]
MILLIGATGKVGGAAARELLRRGLPTRVLTREPAGAVDLAAAGAEVVVGDLQRPETLPPALDGVERLLLSTAPGPSLVAEQAVAIEAARTAGVSHVVRVSALGAQAGSDVNLADWHGRLDDILRASAAAWTILQPHWFAQNYLMQAASIAREGVIYGAMGEGCIAPVDVADIAAVAVAALTETGHEGQRYMITGPESLSQAEVAAAIGRGIGHDVRYVDLSADALARGLRDAGLPGWLVEGMLGLHAVYAAGHGDLVTDAVERVGRVRPTAIESFAAAHAPAFALAPGVLA